MFIFVLLMSIKIFASLQKTPETKENGSSITLDFKKIPLRELLQFIAESMNFNIIMSDSVTGNISLHFHDVGWGQAFDSILEMAGLVKKQKGNILLIATANEFAQRQKNLTEASAVKIIKVKLQHVDATLISALLKNQTEFLTPNAKISVNPRENSILVKESVENLPILMSYLRQMDQPEKQIVISAKVLNVDDKKMHELGINFNSAVKNNSIKDLTFSLPEREVNSFQIAIASIAQNQLLNLQIEALETAGFSKLIADPKLITQNRKTAIIEAGEEIPYQESTSSGATSVNFKKAALSLKVTPTILPDGQIILDLEISQNKISPLAVNGTPAIETQELKTQVIVRDGQTVILGGIFEKSDAELIHKLPIIANLPLIGGVFSRRECNLVRKELLIFVSPRVMTEKQVAS